MTRISDVLLLHGRGLEWLTSWVLFVFALTLVAPGDTLAANPSFTSFIAAGLDETALALPISWIASTRFAGLLINGMWKRSPFLRMAGAILGAMIFLFLAVMFALPYLTGQVSGLSPAAGFYLVLCAFDVLAAYRTGADARYYQRA